jgi:hypothetical protein
MIRNYLSLAAVVTGLAFAMGCGEAKKNDFAKPSANTPKPPSSADAGKGDAKVPAPDAKEPAKIEPAQTPEAGKADAAKTAESKVPEVPMTPDKK